MLSKPRLLLLSSSRTPGAGFLEHARPHIRAFLGEGVRSVLFIPYAAVSKSHDEMAAVVAPVFAELGYSVTSLHSAANPVAAVRAAEAVAVSGGNTFRLLQLIQSQGLLQPLRERAQAGMPYIGWSAGSNLACPTIRTTNDMPIVWPSSYEALGLIPFQINPHYTEHLPPEHQGETRDDRLREFMRLNPGVPVLGLREGSALKLEADRLELLGTQSTKLFLDGQSRELDPQESLQFLLYGNPA
ncbi:MAG TPA: dipeptidase PepE [Gammaproteobacteria bacterium]|jgi:dipeptidase E|nr:dipeptidase PepE [Gammaproteobacteria bacterium]